MRGALRRARQRGPVAVVAALVAVALAGCGIPSDAVPSTIPRTAVPFHLLDPRTPTTTVGPTTPPVGVEEQIFLVTPAQHVSPVVRDVAPPATLTEILGALLDGPTEAESAAGLQSFLTGQSSDVTATLANGIVTVDFAVNPFQIVGPDQTLAVAQVVFTASTQPGVVGVLFEIAGKPIEVPTAAGAQVPGPVTDATYAAQAPLPAATTAPSTTAPSTTAPSTSPSGGS